MDDNSELIDEMILEKVRDVIRDDSKYPKSTQKRPASAAGSGGRNPPTNSTGGSKLQ